MIYAGQGTPEGAVTAVPGALYLQTDGAPGAQLWQKETGTGESGWTAITTPVTGTVSLSDGALGTPSLRFSGDTDTGFFREETAGSTVLHVVINGYTVMQLFRGAIEEVNISGRTLGVAEGNSTLPAYHFSGVQSNGMYTEAGTLQLAFARLAVKVLALDGSAVAGETRLLIYDVNAGAMQRVKVGANGTGPGGVGRALYLDNV